MISIEDAQLTLIAYTNRIAGNDMGLQEPQREASDVTRDGEISVDDAQLILKYYTENTVAGKHVTWFDLMYRPLSLTANKNIDLFGERTLSWQENDGQYTMTLDGTLLKSLEKVERNMLYDDGENMIDFGLENAAQHISADGCLVADQALEWVCVNGMRAFYYYLYTDDETDMGYGYFLAELNDEDVKVIVSHDSLGNGKILGYREINCADSDLMNLADATPFSPGSRLYMLSHDYNYDGTYNCDSIWGREKNQQEEVNIGRDTVTGGEGIYISYRLTDKHGNQFWTDAIAF